MSRIRMILMQRLACKMQYLWEFPEEASLFLLFGSGVIYCVPEDEISRYDTASNSEKGGEPNSQVMHCYCR